MTTVWTVGDPVLGRVDTSGSALALPAAETDTTLLVATESGYRRWMTGGERPQDFPFMAHVGETLVQVNAVDGVTSPQVFTLVAPIGTALAVGTDVRIARQAVPE